MTDTQQTVYVVEDDEAVRDSLELLLNIDQVLSSGGQVRTDQQLFS